jgi:cell division transport system permease protein
MNRWIGQHWHALLQALRNTASAPISFLLNALVISVAFSLPLMGLTALENLRPLSAKLVTEPEISLFMGMNVSRDTALALQADIQRIVQRLVQRGDRSTDRNRQRSGKIVFKPREAAFAELKQRAGLSDALSVLGDNPLLLLGAMLGVVVITVVFNTIRLQVLTQREEIAVSQLVGATNGYIVRPFYYAGALLGTAAAAIALGTVAALLYPINTAVADFAHLYASDFALHPLGLATTSLLLLLGAFLGFSGALLSVSRHLSSKVA